MEEQETGGTTEFQPPPDSPDRAYWERQRMIDDIVTRAREARQ